MNRNGAMMFIFTLGMSSLMTFTLGLLLGYALFSPRVQPVQQAATQPPAETAPPAEPNAEQPKPSTSTQQPATTPTPAHLASNTPDTTTVVTDADDLQVSRHLFIAVNGQWLADGTRALLQEIQPGGVILRASNVTSGVQVRSLVQEIKATSGGAHPYDWPLIAVSQEGGLGNTLRVEEAVPSVELGLSNDKQYARQLGQTYGRTAADYGINVILGPMLDVYDDTTAFPDLRTRSFGPDQTRVAALGLAMAEGIREGGVVSVAKSFPGYASAGYSSDGISVVMHQDFDGLARAMYPFSEAADSAIQGMVVGHVGVPLLDKDDPYRSAALSPVMVTELVRNRWQYNGVLIADDIAYNSMTRSRPVERAAVEALLAGCDAVIFLDPNPDAVRAVITAIERAVAVGELSAEQLNRSKGRLDKWRFALGGQPIQKPAPEQTQVAMLQDLAANAPGTQEVVPTPPALDVPSPIVETPETTPAPDTTVAPETEGDTPQPAPETVDTPGEETQPAPETETPAEPEMQLADAANIEPPAEEPAPAETAPEPEEEPLDISDMVPIDYIVQDGETLLDIAWAYDVSTDDIIKWNGLESAKAEAGSTLKLYLPATGSPPEPPVTVEPEEVPAPESTEPDPQEAELEEKMVIALNAIEKQHQPDSEEAQAPPEETTPEETTPEPEPETTTPETEPAPAPDAAVTPPAEPAPDATPPVEETPEPQADAPDTTPAPEPETTPEPPEEMKVAEADPEPAPAPEETVPEPEVIEPAPEAETEAPATSSTTPYKIVHQVQWGETLTSIATSYGVDVIDIRHWNEMAPDAALQANSSLLIYVDSEEKLTETKKQTTVAVEKVATYTVQTGDTMSKIARKHNTNVDVIVRLNTLKNPNAIFVGQKLKVPAI